MFFKKTKKAAVSLLLSIFVFSSLAGFLLSASPANAQLTTIVAGDVPAQAQSIYDLIKNGWKIAVLNAAQQAVSYFLRKVAYDGAVWLASGGKGQTPFANTQGFGDYMASVGSDAAGTAIEQLGKGFGLDLCKIPDVKLDLALRIGLHYNYALGSEPTKPACNLTTFKQNWSGDAWASKYGDGSGSFEPSKVFNSSLSVQNTDLGVTMQTTEKIDRLVANQTNAAQASRAEGQGYKAATNLISGNIKTPSQVIKKESEANTPSEQNKKSEAQISAAMGSGAYEIIPSTLSLFLNTLAGQMLKNFKENGMLPGGLCIGSYGDPSCKKQGSQAQNYDAGGPVAGRVAAEAIFSEFLTTKIDTLNDYDILAQLNSCDSHGLYNCRADQGLVQAIQEAKHGTPVTIEDAMKKGWLHPNARLIPPSRSADNADPNCYNDPTKYCYSNLAVLRQLRIFPLGLEIAAKNSDPDHPWTLKEAVDGFYDCNYNKDGTVNYDGENKPFCHLVDPNWVIQLSQTRCDAKAPGPIPLSGDVPDRISECVDVKTCIGTDKDGNCAGFGYCVREKNVWRFDADKCDAQYATCRSFNDSTGKQVAYLYRTLDTGECNQNTAGCQAYSLQQDDSGQWKDVAATNYGNYSTGIYLNKNVSTACSANSAGCSAFTLPGDTTGVVARLKKAPDYLNCYDVDANASNGITWPKTFSDISKMKPNEQCKNFAQVCIADEVGCSLYQSADDSNGDQIPGKFKPAVVENNVVTKWNDQCDSRCVGYGAYREMPTNYSAGTGLSYIVPPSKYNQNQSGQVCAAADVGCSSFTNLNDTSGGGEKVEYFTNLRSCINPDQAKQKNYYTYEGSVASGGYQLQAYTLEQDPLTGGPKYDFSTAVQQADADEFKCNEDLYKAGSADPDCRQFNDDKGVIYYRLLSHTIVVSNDCTTYRLNSSELEGPEKCFGTGEYKDGVCIYHGLPANVVTNAGSSESCSAQAVSCRAYKGNNGNNVKTIFNDKFEDQTSVSPANGWGSSAAGNIFWSTESTRAGEHSLGFAGQGTMVKAVNLQADSLDLQSDMSYSLTFWAKGSGSNVDISATDGKNQTVNAGTISVNNTWQYFKFNLIELQSVGTSTINFKVATNGNLFLDNVRLTKVTNFVYLVKDSLKVDPVCDDNPTDNLPGAALGCSAYKGPQNSLGNNLYFLTNFSFLCRDGAIGCTAFKDTFNTISDTGPRAYNVRLSGTTGTKVTAKIVNDSYSCQIEQGKTDCLVNVKGHTKAEIEAATGAKAEFINSTYFVPSDTPDNDPIYLVANEAASCGEADLGCTAAGLQKSTPSGNKFDTVNIKLDPQQFEAGVDASGNPQSGILCQKAAVGCVEYSSSQGSSYFKDPAIVGSKICKYKTVDLNNNKVKGWFWEGVGTCANKPSKNCSTNDDCTVNGVTSTCENTDVTPCYPDYLKNGNEYGLWSYGDKDKYQNFVGECDVAQDSCTQFVDHADDDKSYYFLKNNKITQGDCGGMASQKAGCALFDQTDNPNKFWNTAATYLLSDDYIPAKGADLSLATKVKPVDSAGKNDANIIIKVNRDRECSEWLQPVLSSSVYDSNNSKWKKVSYRVGLCSRADDNNNPDACNAVAQGDVNSIDGITTESDYVQRDITWHGSDWSGYSILNQYPPNLISQVNIGSESKPVWTLGKKIVCGNGGNCDPKNPDETACILSNNITPCGKNGEGSCINAQCVQNINGKSFENVDLESRKQICRAYPEASSPFPDLEGIKVSSQFGNVNKCSEGNNGSSAMACECDYTKVNYGVSGFSRYFNFSHDLSPADSGVCIGGKNDAQFCDPNNAEATCPGGNCQKFTTESQLVGWRGYCLEEDKSRSLFGYKDQHPCLTWYPVDALTGAKDINYQHKDAGFVAPVNAAYCYKGNLFARPTVVKSPCPAGYSPADQPGKPNKCISDFAIPYDPIKLFGVYSNKAADMQIYCQQPVALDELVIAATDNIWKDSNKPQELSGNFPLTPTAPYAITNKGIYKSPFSKTDFKSNGLISLPQCQKPPFNFKKVISDKSGNLSCDSYGEGFVLTGAENGGSYNAWGFRDALVWDGKTSDYNPLCKDDTDCNQSQFVSEPDTNNFCALQCSDDKQCGVGGKCIGYGDVSLCNQSVPNTTYDYNVAVKSGTNQKLMTAEDIAKAVNFDPCQSGYFGYTSPADGKTHIWYGYQYIDTASAAQSVCKTANNSGAGWGCIAVVPHSGNYTNLNTPVLCHNQTNTDFEFATATTFVKGGNNGNDVQNCGLNSKDVPKCVDYSLGDTGGDFALELQIKKCTNQPLPKLVVLDENISGTKLNSGENLKKLLVSVDKTYKWQFTPGSSGQVPSSGYLPDNPWDNTNDLSSGDVGESSAPVIHPVSNNCILGDKCMEVNTDGVSINNVWDHDVWIKNKIETLDMKFYAWADKNHMPLRRMWVDWGDGTEKVEISQAYIRNHKGAVNSTCDKTKGKCVGYENKNCVSDSDCQFLDQCLPADQAKDFGSVANLSCDNAFFDFTYSYKCTKDSPQYQPSCPVAEKDKINFPNGCCVYKPKVQVKDNWDWCNGTCDGKYGCYDGQNNKGCSNTQFISNVPFKHSNTQFKGNVLVVPIK